MPWYQLFNSLLFWQAVWFLYFQSELSGAQAIVLYSVYDIATTVLEVPSGYFSDRLGRRVTLMLSTLCYVAGCLALAAGGGFAVLALGQVLIGAGAAFKSGTDSALLFEALEAQGRAAEIEQQELRAWRFTLAGFALSAVLGSVMFVASATLPFIATALAYGVALGLVLAMSEPPQRIQAQSLRADAASLRAGFRHPVLVWLFVLSVLMYGFSHLPFVFGQPFILTAMEGLGLSAQAPVVSGAVTSAMMLVAAAASVVALRIRRALGLPLVLLCAFGLQIALSAALALSVSALVIGVLVLRMVPDSLARPFILARIQPLLEKRTRATYLSLQSLGGKVFFAITLMGAATTAQDAGLLPPADLQRILTWYAAGGITCLAALALAARRIAVEQG